MSEATRVLVVDDEAAIRELLLEMLHEEGFAAEAVGDAQSALNVLDQHDDFAILLTDINMPKMTGIELIHEALRRRPQLIPIVMTGCATLESARAAVQEGAYDYVPKPFSLSDIKMAVTNALERYRLSTENTRLRELTGLFNIGETIAGIHEERALLDFVLRAALERVGADRGSLMMKTPDGKALVVSASVGLPDEAANSVIGMGTGISGWVAEHVQPLLVEDLQDNPHFGGMSQHRSDTSFISIPLERRHPERAGLSGKSPGDVVAVLNVSQKRSGEHFTEGDLKVLSIVANHAAVAIENVRLIKGLEEAHLATLESIALLLEARDPYTHGHSERVRGYCLQVARKLNLDSSVIEVLRLGAALHDIGKVGVTDTVLNKAGSLTNEEWNLIRRHPSIGSDVLTPVRFLSQMHVELVRHHHERLDGTGYPDGIRGEQVPLHVRIISIADAYDAMSSSRAYRKAMEPPLIIRELERARNAQLDPNVVDVFTAMIQSGELTRPGT